MERTGLITILAGLRHLLFPPKCALCGKIVPESAGQICPVCRGNLVWREEPAVLEDGAFRMVCSVPLHYEGDLRAAFLRFKFRGRDCYAPLLGRLLADGADRQLEGDFDFVTWAPVSPQRKKKRGYDQGYLLARVAAEELELPLVSTLRKVRNTRPQSRMDTAEQRMENAAGAYAPVPGVEVAGKRILLVDDILTTGSTMTACAQVLWEAGAAELSGAVLASPGLHRHTPD